MDYKACESLEEVLKRVQFKVIDLEQTNLDEDVREIKSILVTHLLLPPLPICTINLFGTGAMCVLLAVGVLITPDVCLCKHSFGLGLQECADR